MSRVMWSFLCFILLANSILDRAVGGVGKFARHWTKDRQKAPKEQAAANLAHEMDELGLTRPV